MLIDEIIDDEKVTTKLQEIIEYIDANKEDIEEIFNTMYGFAVSKFPEVTRNEESITIPLNSDVERDLCEEFYNRFLIKALEEKLTLDREYFYLIYKIYSTKSYVMIVQKRK